MYSLAAMKFIELARIVRSLYSSNGKDDHPFSANHTYNNACYWSNKFQRFEFTDQSDKVISCICLTDVYRQINEKEHKVVIKEIITRIERLFDIDPNLLDPRTIPILMRNGLKEELIARTRNGLFLASVLRHNIYGKS